MKLAQKNVHMKKYLFILLGLLLFSNVFSQNIRFSVFADPQFSWLTPESRDVEKEGSILGIDVGLSMDKYFAPNYAISSGVSIMSTGGKLIYNDTIKLTVHDEIDTIAAGNSMEYNLQYINVPLGLKFKTNEIGYFTFYADLGIDAGVRIKARGTSDEEDISDEDVSEEISLFRLGYYIGGGMEYSLGGNSAIILGIVYNNGFIDAFSNDSETDATQGRFSIKLGILF